jgi:hypothetical protein
MLMFDQGERWYYDQISLITCCVNEPVCRYLFLVLIREERTGE